MIVENITRNELIKSNKINDFSNKTNDSNEVTIKNYSNQIVKDLNNVNGNFQNNSSFKTYSIKSIYKKNNNKEINDKSKLNVSFGHNVDEVIIKYQMSNDNNNNDNNAKISSTEETNSIKLYRPISSRRLLDQRPISSIAKNIKIDCDQIKFSLKKQNEFDWNYKDFLKAKNSRFQYFERSNYVLKHHDYNKINNLCFNDLENVKISKEKIKNPGNRIFVKNTNTITLKSDITSNLNSNLNEFYSIKNTKNQVNSRNKSAKIKELNEFKLNQNQHQIQFNIKDFKSKIAEFNDNIKEKSRIKTAFNKNCKSNINLDLKDLLHKDNSKSKSKNKNIIKFETIDKNEINTNSIDLDLKKDKFKLSYKNSTRIDLSINKSKSNSSISMIVLKKPPKEEILFKRKKNNSNFNKIKTNRNSNVSKNYLICKEPVFLNNENDELKDLEKIKNELDGNLMKYKFGIKELDEDINNINNIKTKNQLNVNLGKKTEIIINKAKTKKLMKIKNYLDAIDYYSKITRNDIRMKSEDIEKNKNQYERQHHKEKLNIEDLTEMVDLNLINLENKRIRFNQLNQKQKQSQYQNIIGENINELNNRYNCKDDNKPKINQVSVLCNVEEKDDNKFFNVKDSLSTYSKFVKILPNGKLKVIDLKKKIFSSLIK